MLTTLRRGLPVAAAGLLLGCAAEGGGGRWNVDVSDGRSWRSIQDWPPGMSRPPGQPERMTTVWVRATIGNRPAALVHAERLGEGAAQTARSMQQCGAVRCPPSSPPPANLISTPERQAEAQRLFQNAFELFRRGEFDAAFAGFASGLRYGYQPANAPANFYLAEILMRRGRYRDAALRYAMAMHLAPSSPEGLQARARLANFGREPDGRLSPEVVENIERHTWIYNVTDRLNRFKNCGFPTGRRFFLDDLALIRAEGGQISRLTAAYDREVATWDWRADCAGYAGNALNPRDGNAAIPRMWDLTNSQTFLSLLYDLSSMYSTEDQRRFREQGILRQGE
ncbi:MAG: hypothetical protein N3D18_04345 [Roseococcus sp.]|nr:hypothetical protein [Roseococcus sp.]